MQVPLGSDNKWAGLHIEPVHADDGPGVVQCLNEVFGQWGDFNDWQWKYQFAPTSFKLECVVARYKGRIIGHYGLLPVEVSWQNQKLRVAQAVDAGVLAEFRRGGIFTTLAHEAIRHAIDTGVHLIYAFPGLLSLDVNYRLGYQPVAFVPEMTRLLDLKQALTIARTNFIRDITAWWNAYRQRIITPDSTSRLLRLRSSMLLLASFATLPTLSKSMKAKTDEISIKPIDRFDDRFDTFWAQFHQSTTFSLSKESRYMNWRYISNRNRHYQILAVEDGDQLVGCLVMRHSGLRSEITDLLVDPQSHNAGMVMLLEAINQARKAGSIGLSIWATPEHPYYVLLRQLGFISSNHLFRLAEIWPMLARWLYQVIVYLEHLPPMEKSQMYALSKSWQLSMGDSDLV
jgi:GNAT superfamily N-acetyltransferase